ncbi:MAG TPA: alpha/beta hydrolase fold domain-containing protein [Bacteroidia bacterium]|nr:alpha/beta hydrolase fold domain-containing protein [Bacteroidia bacterium]HRG52590.1 alpha/beta hydrolase fold domain-containing protein [Bacteroidia bacterium]
MRKKLLLFLLIILVIPFYGQRYLTPVFSSSTITKNIVYGNALNYKNSNTILKLDVYEPSGDTENKRPLIVYMHGGGFTDTNQTKSFPHIAMFCDSLARRGYVIASVDYRLDSSISNRAIINAMHDARAAVRFFKVNASLYKIDTSNIFLGGESAGAINALSVNYIDQASELTYPPVAPYSTEGTVEGNSGNPGPSSKARATLCFCGGTKTVLLDPVFDTTTIQSVDPPMLQVHGTGDPIIPIQYALEIKNRAKTVGLPHTFHPLPGATHCPWFFTSPSWQAYLDTLIHFTSTYIHPYLIITDVNQSNSIKTTRLYPNPFSSFITIETNKELENVTLSIYRLNGQCVKEIKNSSGRQFMIHRDGLGSGFYFLKLIQANKIISIDKLVIIDN